MKLLVILLLCGCPGRNDPKAACAGRRAETIGGAIVIGCR